MTTKQVWFDYENQAWVENGVYVTCGHDKSKPCGCYGRQHAGERPKDTECKTK